jgi:hypothetical protein
VPDPSDAGRSGKTAVLELAEARVLLASIDWQRSSICAIGH